MSALRVVGRAVPRRGLDEKLTGDGQVYGGLEASGDAPRQGAPFAPSSRGRGQRERIRSAGGQRRTRNPDAV